MTCEEGVLSVQSDRSDQVFDTVIVDLDAPIVQEGLQTVPVIVDVGQLFDLSGFGRNLTALRLQSFTEGCVQRGAASLTGGQALSVQDTMDISFNGINLGDAAQAFDGVLWSVTVEGFLQLAPGMGTAMGHPNGVATLARGFGRPIVALIFIDLQDTKKAHQGMPS